MLLDWFPSSSIWAALISILLNVVIAITGIFPSTFITVATVSIFSFEYALTLLIIGEAIGAIVSFILYRKGAKKLLSKPKMSTIANHKYLQKLGKTGGMTAVFIILLLRVMPFVPSGAVTLTAALSPIHVIPFSIASTLGKIPALFIEAYSVSHVLTLSVQYQITIMIVVLLLFLVYLGFKKKRKEINE
ncbi:VTT domain-containing protein [Niallia sp. XMNu-256]|uniref:TVP38/TMEM64 family protein n=1 Tax=Niallia sp. XMNu-256 TaxID=3082444 RepID=UPI0030D2BA74